MYEQKPSEFLIPGGQLEAALLDRPTDAALLVCALLEALGQVCGDGVVVVVCVYKNGCDPETGMACCEGSTGSVPVPCGRVLGGDSSSLTVTTFTGCRHKFLVLFVLQLQNATPLLLNYLTSNGALAPAVILIDISWFSLGISWF